MWEFVSDIIYAIVLTGASFIALDYIFGTDKFKGVREALVTTHVQELVAGAAILIIGSLHMLAHFLESTTFKDLTTFYMCIAWGYIWLYHTVVNVKNGITTFRNNSILKRKKPQ